MLRYRHAACTTATLSLSQATIAGGGVIPHIHKSLINKVRCLSLASMLFISSECMAHLNSFASAAHARSNIH